MEQINITTERIRLLCISIACFLASFLYLLIIASPQINITATTANPEGKIYLAHSDSKLELQKKPVQTDASFELTVVGDRRDSKTRRLQVGAIKTWGGGYLEPTQIETTGSWSLDNSSRYKTSFTTEIRGAKLQWHGYVSGLVIPVRKDRDAPVIEIQWNGQRKRYDLYSEQGRWDEITLTGDQWSFFTTLPLFSDSLLLETDSGLQLKQVLVTLGDRIVYQDSPGIIEKSTAIRIDLPQRLISIAVQDILKNSAFLLSICFYLCFVHFLAGLPLVLLARLDASRAQTILLSVVAGFFMVNILTTSLIYVFALKTALKLAIGAILILYGILALNWKTTVSRSLSLLKDPDRDTTEILVLLPFAATGVLFFFSPAVSEPGWFLGRSVTDSFYYINQAQNLISNPQELPVRFFTLETIRFADLTTIATNAIFTWSDTKRSYLYSAVFLWFLLPFVSHRLVRRFCSDRQLSILIALCIAYSCNLYSLFAFSFLAHYYFGITLLFSLYFSTLLVEKISDLKFSRNALSLCILTALSFAYCLALYPYHFFLPVTTVLTLIILFACNREYFRFKPLLVSVFALTGFTLLMANVNLVSPIASLGYIKHYSRDLNIMAVSIFPFYNSSELGSIVLGLSGLGQLQGSISDIAKELLQPGDRLLQIFLSISPFLGQVVLAIVSALVLYATVIGFFSNHKALVFWACTICFYLVVIGILYSRHQIYGYVKLLISVGPLLSLMMLVGAHELFGRLFRGKKVFHFVLASFCSVVLLLNLSNSFMENSLASLNRNSKILATHYTGLPVITTALKQLEEVVSRQPDSKKKSLLVLGESTEYKYSDLDRILNNRILHIFSDYKVMYADQNELHYYLGFDFGYIENYHVKFSDYLLVFKGYDQFLSKYPVDRSLLETNLFSLYKLDYSKEEN